MRTLTLLGFCGVILSQVACSAPAEDESEESTGAVSSVEDSSPMSAKADLRWLESLVDIERKLYPNDAMEYAADVKGSSTRPVAAHTNLAVEGDSVTRFELPPASFKYETLEVSFWIGDPPLRLCFVDAQSRGRCVDSKVYRFSEMAHVKIPASEGAVALLVVQQSRYDAKRPGGSSRAGAKGASGTLYVDATWDVRKGPVTLPKP